MSGLVMSGGSLGTVWFDLNACHQWQACLYGLDVMAVCVLMFALYTSSLDFVGGSWGGTCI